MKVLSRDTHTQKKWPESLITEDHFVPYKTLHISSDMYCDESCIIFYFSLAMC